MGKRIIQQARGHGGPAYRVRRKAFSYRIGYPNYEGKAKILRIFSTSSHTAPLALIKYDRGKFYNVAVSGISEEQEIEIGKGQVKEGNILPLSLIPLGADVCNAEIVAGDGGKLVRASGLSAKITKKTPQGVFLLLPSKKEKIFSQEARATIGIVAGSGRTEKPFVKAGVKWHLMKARGKLYPRTKAVAMNAVDHPFGSGRGKRVKSKIAKRNVPPGAKVGLLRPRRTGRKKR